MADPGEQLLALARAQQHLDAGRYRNAEELAREALRQEPTSEGGLRVLARALCRQERFDEGVAAAQHAFGLAPDSPETRRVLVDCLVDAKRYDEAQPLARSAVADQPDDWVAIYSLARSLLDKRRPHQVEALALAERARELAPSNADTHNLVGLCLMTLRRNRRAGASFRRALELEPQHPLAMNNLAVVDLKRRRYGRAARRLSGGLALEPQSPLMRRNLETLTVGMSWRLFLVVWLGGQVLKLEVAVDTSVLPRLVTWLVIGLVVAVVATRLARSLPRGYRRPDTLWHELGLFFRYLLGLCVLTYAVLLVAAVGSEGVAAGAVRAFLTLTVVAIVSMVGYAMNLRRRRRSSGR